MLRNLRFIYKSNKNAPALNLCSKNTSIFQDNRFHHCTSARLGSKIAALPPVHGPPPGCACGRISCSPPRDRYPDRFWVPITAAHTHFCRWINNRSRDVYEYNVTLRTVLSHDDLWVGEVLRRNRKRF
jgi:hypothetical protein